MSTWVTAYTAQQKRTFYLPLRQNPQVKKAKKRPRRIDLGHAIEGELVCNSFRSIPQTSQPMESAYGCFRLDVTDLSTCHTPLLVVRY